VSASAGAQRILQAAPFFHFIVGDCSAPLLKQPFSHSLYCPPFLTFFSPFALRAPLGDGQSGGFFRAGFQPWIFSPLRLTFSFSRATSSCLPLVSLAPATSVPRPPFLPSSSAGGGPVP